MSATRQVEIFGFQNGEIQQQQQQHDYNINNSKRSDYMGCLDISRLPLSSQSRSFAAIRKALSFNLDEFSEY